MKFTTKRALPLLHSALCIAAWTLGDLGSQWYEFRMRNLVPDSRDNSKSRDVDISRMMQNALFGICLSPLLEGYRSIVVSAVFGSLRRNSTSTLVALGMHQFFITPVILLGYFNYMTAWRGGLTNRSFMQTHSDGISSRRYTVFSVESYILTEVSPTPLVAAWVSVTPLYAVAYYAPKRMLLPYAALFLTSAAWCGVVSYTQSSLLL